MNKKQFNVYIPPGRMNMAREALAGKTRFGPHMPETQAIHRAVARTSMQPEHLANVAAVHTGVAMRPGGIAYTENNEINMNQRADAQRSHLSRAQFQRDLTHEIGHANVTKIQEFASPAQHEAMAENFADKFSNTSIPAHYDSFKAADWKAEGDTLKNYKSVRASGEIPGDGWNG